MKVEAGPSGSGAPETAPGSRLSLRARDLRIVRVVGRGASATVSKAFYPRINRFVGLKRISQVEREHRAQMMKDLQTLLALYQRELPGLVSFMGAFLSGEESVTLALEYMDGGSLADLLERQRASGKGKGIPEPALGKCAADVLAGLATMHARRTVHRDLKPANVLVSTLGQAKLSDFGIARVNESTLAQCNTYAGTVTYMSPERINSQPYGAPSDIWALGLTLLECHRGDYPYDAKVGPLQLMIHLCDEPAPLPVPSTEMDPVTGKPGTASPEFVDFLSRCLPKDPADRATAEQLVEHPWVLRHAAAGAALSRFVARHASMEEKVNDTAWLMANRFHMHLEGAGGGGGGASGVGSTSKGVERASRLFAQGARATVDGKALDASSGATLVPGLAAFARSLPALRMDTVRTHRVAPPANADAGPAASASDGPASQSARSAKRSLILAHVAGSILDAPGGDETGETFDEVFLIDTSGAGADTGVGYYGCLFINYVYKRGKGAQE